MEPRIQYAKTEDGVSIAYFAVGEGGPLVQMPPTPWSHIQLGLNMQPEGSSELDRLSEVMRVVRYDSSGKRAVGPRRQ